MAALLPVASERGGTAGFDGLHQSELMEGQAMFFAIPGTVGAEDVGDLKGGPGHGVIRRRPGCFPPSRASGGEFWPGLISGNAAVSHEADRGG